MAKTIGTQALRIILILFTVSVLVSLMAHIIPGDVALNILGPESTEEQRNALREQLGLNQGIVAQYLAWLGAVFTGDLGTSFFSGRPVLAEIGSRVWVTLEVVFLAQLLAVVIAVPIGLHAALRRGQRFDTFHSFVAFVLMAIPSYVVGIVLVLIFAVNLGWFPASGFNPISDGLGANLYSIVLPVLTLAIVESAAYMRVLRGSAVETLKQPYVFASETRGATDSQIEWRSVLRPSSLPLINLVGVNMGVAFGGSLLVESIFGLPGLGQLALTAVSNRDIPVIQGVVLFAAIAVIVMNLIVDVVQRMVDPRGARA